MTLSILNQIETKKFKMSIRLYITQNRLECFKNCTTKKDYYMYYSVKISSHYNYYFEPQQKKENQKYTENCYCVNIPVFSGLSPFLSKLRKKK